MPSLLEDSSFCRRLCLCDGSSDTFKIVGLALSSATEPILKEEGRECGFGLFAVRLSYLRPRSPQRGMESEGLIEYSSRRGFNVQ
jgi:hypothetical protein